jgi:hypothetical protein
MFPKFPVISGKETISRLEKLGFIVFAKREAMLLCAGEIGVVASLAVKT